MAVVLGSAALVLWSSALFAADQAKSDSKKEDEELSEVQVTGTRIQTPNATASNPVTSISGEEMRRLGIVNVSDALTQLVPQNISTYTPTMTGDDQAGRGGGGMEGLDRGSFFIGQTVANLRGLDPTFGSRTLTLIDGRRVVSSSNQADVVDLNIIPSNLLDRVDVVTGGASATYGSGAVAGVVNLVLNHRLTGVNLDMDYGVTEAGDGNSPHIALSGGTTMFEGKGHILLGAEWQKTQAIRDCAAARDWCAESRQLFTNQNGGSTALTDARTALPGFEGLPARFEMANVRYSQFAPTGTIYVNDASVTSDYRFSNDGTQASEYSLGYRGGAAGIGNSFGATSAMNADGPLTTSGTPLQPSNQRKTLFTNFEYDLTPTTTAYVQGNFAKTNALNVNHYTSGVYCTRFDTGGTPGTNAAAQTVLVFSTTAGGTVNGANYTMNRSAQFNTITAPFVQFLGIVNSSGAPVLSTAYAAGNGLAPNANGSAAITYSGSTYNGKSSRGVAWPYWIPTALLPGGPPAFNFNGNGVGKWVKFSFANWGPSNTFYTADYPNEFWLLESVTLTTAYDAGTTTTLPVQGRNAYAFLNNLSQDALFQVEKAFNNSTTTGASPGVDTLYGATPCNGYTAIRKVWNPQIQQSTTNESQTWGSTVGMKGRFGSDWRWDASYQYGSTDSNSVQYNVATNVRMAFAMDAVIDDRVGSATYGTPICRITRDGPPVLDTTGRPLSTASGLVSLAQNCKPLDVFGNTYANTGSFAGYVDGSNNPIAYNPAQLQQQALDYAFVDTSSSGTTTLQAADLNTSGTLWQGWAGPLTGAFGLDLRANKVDNKGSKGDYYLRADLANSWADAFGGTSKVAEGYAEFSMPIVSGRDGIELWSVDIAGRYGLYNNKGGAGTTGDSNTTTTPNWKFSTDFAPFDWVRFRMTRSEDLRAPGYRDLFLYQPGIPDQLTILNPWRERTATSTENQQERYGQIMVGNPDLKPEKSNTITIGMVLSPGGWAQGMRMSFDYTNIRVKDGINTPFNANSPVQTCFTQSGNVAPVYSDGEILDPGVNGLFDANNPYCQQIVFAQALDAGGNPIPGSRNLQDVVSYNSARPQNGLPYQTRSIDMTWSYNFPLNRAFEGLPGSMALNVRGTRALEASGVQQTSTFGTTPNTQACGAALERADPQNYDLTGTFRVLNRYNCVNLVGQIRTSTFIPGVAATPKWIGNVSASYLYGDLTATLSARYIGGAKMDVTWIDNPLEPGYYAANGQPSNASVDNNKVDPYLNFSLNGSYNLKVSNMKQFQIFGSINNLFDKSPPFTGGGISGASAGYNDTLGRAYRMGVRLKF